MRTLFALALISIAPAALASSPAGVWAVPSNVSVNDGDSATPSVIITGVFTVHTGSGSEGSEWGYSGFLPASDGYMHFVCKAGDKDLCLLQWQEIAAAIGGESCVGWSEMDLVNGSVHATGTALGQPDTWNLGLGVVSGYSPCNYLASYDPPAGDVADPTADVAEPAPTDTSSPMPPLDTSEVSADTAAPEDTTVTPVEGASDTAMTGQPADDGCAGGPMGLLGLLALALFKRR